MTAAAITVEASAHRASSPSATITIAPGSRIKLTGFEWGRRRLAILYAGLLADAMPPCQSVEHEVSRHESFHCTVSFVTGAPLGGASIITVPGHSAGRTSNLLPQPGERLISDAEGIEDLKLIGGPHFDCLEIERFTSRLLTNYAPLARRLAGVLLQKKVLTGRQVRLVLIRGLRKDWRRALALQERDRREQVRSRRAIKQAIGARSPLRSTAKVYFRYAVWALAGPLAERAQPNRRSVADHEAGHGVIGWLQGFTVISISIGGRPDIRIGKSSVQVGCCTVASPTADLTPWPDCPMLSDRQIAARSCLAAAALKNMPGWRGGVRQYRRARDEAKRLIRENWPLIIELSAQLSLHRELNAGQIANILGPRDGKE